MRFFTNDRYSTKVASSNDDRSKDYKHTKWQILTAMKFHMTLYQ